MHVSVDGADLSVDDSGGADPTVLIPTGGGIDFYRNTFSQRFAIELRVIYVEVRGTGNSTGTISGATFGSLAEDLERVRAELKLGAVAVLGQSNHGCIALEYGLRFPHTTCCVTSVASVPAGLRSVADGMARWDREADEQRKADLALRQKKLDALAAEGGLSEDELAVQFQLAMTPFAWHDSTIDAWPLWNQRAPKGFGAFIAWLQDELFVFDIRLSDVEVPVLAVSGRYDYLCPVERWTERITQLPAGSLEVFENSAHNPQIEEQAHFDDLVIDFIRRHDHPRPLNAD
jgi:proline iminopeptidase